ncbi:hypothetical protein TMEN_5812 [Trichophyton mentagrophytes]|uniref:Signal peptidase complex subunit 2 n=2 Tax=Trichophyton interdigitale TaxID=101480 RepID=A0A9P5CWP6_9EURO|nr:hypothetical protein H101_00450 [Trichophyton interdigitale H6]KAF3898288.1 hypothetical protein GY631_1197 [Trichophyton interdigitale]KDB23357.1 hypothetical protein H109_04742 [Trichophyton interdigitale MR816]GBF63190.1 hypothetical protein TMEN_5812 [Trichophyton mentagrophytes]KAF3900254.1 hypothetical protein GY632_0920 [Trichophyton interdigitale]
MPLNSPVPVPVYASSELKNTSDDAITTYLTLGLPKPNRFVANHTKTDIRLIIGYCAVTIAGVSFYFDYTKGWEFTAPWMIYAVIAYFILNTVYTGWVWLVENRQVFEGTTPKGETLQILSLSKKLSSTYKLHFRHTSASGKVVQEKTIEAPFSKWFSADGTLHFEPFSEWLKNEIKLVQASSLESSSK